MLFKRLDFNKFEKSYIINNKRFFNPYGNISNDTLEKCFDFAYNMSFSNKGVHRNYRSGGTISRKKGQIFSDTFQGKLAECVTCEFFSKFDKNVKVDFSISGYGTWDSADLVVGNKNISVKSTKAYSQLLLLETKDWDKEGLYIPNKKNATDICAYDFFVLVRIKPYCEEILKTKRLLYENDQIESKKLKDLIFKEKWEYDFAGFITHSEFVEIINSKNYIIPKGAKLGKYTIMDAENYYVQVGNLHYIDEFYKFL